MEFTADRVVAEYEWIHQRTPVTVSLLNETREYLGRQFDTVVDLVTQEAYRREVDRVFADGEVGVNVAAYVGLLRDLDVADDYPGFVVDEVLGRELAATIAGGQPLSVLAQATFHIADVHTHGAGDDAAGLDDLDAALAAGFQTRLPGWDWRAGESPFAVDPDEL